MGLDISAEEVGSAAREHLPRALLQPRGVLRFLFEDTVTVALVLDGDG
jgi:hypothetical protein